EAGSGLAAPGGLHTPAHRGGGDGALFPPDESQISSREEGQDKNVHMGAHHAPRPIPLCHALASRYHTHLGDECAHLEFAADGRTHMRRDHLWMPLALGRLWVRAARRLAPRVDRRHALQAHAPGTRPPGATLPRARADGGLASRRAPGALLSRGTCRTRTDARRCQPSRWTRSNTLVALWVGGVLLSVPWW